MLNIKISKNIDWCLQKKITEENKNFKPAGQYALMFF
jgi:hypothetical protein